MSSSRPKRELNVDDEDIFIDEIDVQRYDVDDASDEEDPVYITIEDDDEDALFATPSRQFIPMPKEFELPSYSLPCGLIRPGTVVEMKDHTGRRSGNLLSGDFLLVKAVIENVDSEDVVLRGYRMRRCSYLQPLFDNILNDLFMLIETQDDDQRPPFIQGLENVNPDEVLRIRKCIFTNLDSKLMGSQHYVPSRLTTDFEKIEWIFTKGSLICRWVHIVEHHFTNGVSYSGEVRRMYKREVAEYSQHFAPPSANPGDSTPRSPLQGPSRTPNSPIKRKLSVEEASPRALPRKNKVYTMADGYCGCGGASEGARQAGLHVVWGLEKDEAAMQAYRQNFPSTMHLQMDAHDFPKMVQRRIHGCDHLHMSCPCRYWSEAHTCEGKDDEASILTLYTVEPWLEKIKPRTFSLEQAPGLLKIQKHRKYFRILLNGILKYGYNVRYKVQNLAWFGVPQSRRRLVFVGAKIGTPLPPFPSPVHGPSRSGLKRFVTIEDALRPIVGQEPRLRHDKYHQPHKEKLLNKEPINPHVSLAKCITVSGGDNAHHSGTRANTVRELSAFQGFPLSYKFFGTITDAKKQCGNAWPPISNKPCFLLWAATLEAFDNGLIHAEDDIQDLLAFLEAKGIRIPKPEPIDVDMLSSTLSSAEIYQQEYRYLSKLEKTVTPCMPLGLWTRTIVIQPLPKRQRARPALGFGLSNRPVSMPIQPRRQERALVVRSEQEEINFFEELFSAQDSGSYVDLTF